MKTKDLEKLVFPMPKRNLTAQEHKELVQCYHAYKKAKNIRPYLCNYSRDKFTLAYEVFKALTDSHISGWRILTAIVRDINGGESLLYLAKEENLWINKELRLVWLRKLIAFRGPNNA